ncbi:MAG: hypothetical protein KAT68_00300 [Bacteroidales bacterium]|nr:hypothetical protein [Bacteroidales bacterium]
MNIKKINLIFIFLVFYSSIIAQPFGNEWINFSQQYFRLSVYETGIYRITSSELEEAGVPTGSFNPQNIQIFYKGEEQHIYIKGEDLGLIEYIEFFAEKNNGWFDAGVYKTPENQTNPYYSLFNDTSSYFLTWNSSFNNLRLVIETDTNFEQYNSPLYCIKDTLVQYTNKFYSGVTEPEYTTGEGWFDNLSLSLGGSLIKIISTPNAFSSGPQTEITTAVAGYSSYRHHLNISLDNNIYVDTIYEGKISVKLFFNISSNLLSSSNNFKFSSINDIAILTDYSTVSYILIKYPHTWQFEDKNNFLFTIPESTGEKIKLEITDFNDDGNPPVFYDMTNGKRIKTVLFDNKIKTLITNSYNKINCFICSENAVKKISNIYPVSLTDFSEQANSYIIISHPILWDKATEYKEYRDAFLVNIEELYNQFAFGIQKHPLAIKNFINYIINTWENIPENLLLIGKSINAEAYRKNETNYANTLIPSIGNPPCDNLLTAGLNGTFFEPAIPTGRIAAKNNDEVYLYLNKVKEFENNEPATWMKNILHFGGGSNINEQNKFANFLRAYENTIEGLNFGGIVSTFLKNSSSPIQITQSDSIRNLINSGSSLMTFFGHSSTSGFDQNIDEPSSFYNNGKYPFLFANSCYSGNIHLPEANSTSEKWVLIANKGTIGFFASVYQGYEAELNGYADEFYKNLSLKNYGESIGKIIQQTSKTYQQDQLDNILIKNTCLEFTLHGDPAIVLNSFELPDLTIDQSGIFFTPKNITSEIDSFNLNIIITNIGKAFTDSFTVEINRIYPDGTNDFYNTLHTGCLFKDTFNIKIPTDRIKGAGSNQISIYIDASSQVDELSELNNQNTFTFYISSSDLIPVYPYNFAIVPNSSITLKASTGDPFIQNQQSVFEIDTTNTFDSPFKKSTTITHSGGVIEWAPVINPEQNTTYFWRVSKLPETNGNYNWLESSFTYIPQKTGWSQSHFYQFKNNNYNFIDHNTEDKKFEFITTPKELSCHNIGSPNVVQNLYIEYDIDGNGDYGICNNVNSMVVVIIDSLTLIPWESDMADYGHYDYPKCHSRNRPDKYFIFLANTEGLQNMKTFIENIVPAGNYILVYSCGSVLFQNWDENIIAGFEELGASQIRTVPNNYPYIFFVKKAYPSTVKEVIGISETDEIDLFVDLISNFFYGEISSPIIGPSKNWETLSWNSHSVDPFTTDSIKLKIIGLTNETDEEILIDNIPAESSEVDISGIDANTYPFLKLNFFTLDSVYKTPAQLDNWQIVFDCAGETAINPSQNFYFYKDTLEEGDEMLLSTAFENISDFDMDSLIVSYSIQDRNNTITPISIKKLDSIRAGEILIDTITFLTNNHTGLNYLWIEANPINLESYYQPEQYHFNNIGNKSFYVKKDKTNPLLDITFDGIHILDGEIISAKPEIVIQLKDENKFLALNDTSVFGVYLKSYNGEEKKINFTDNSGNEILTWIPAEIPDNSCKIIYNPVFNEDGTYQLRVQAKDVSNNESGDYDYKISFQIINESTITEILNYPNPFSTSTRFVFTLTGSEIPTDIRIQILTVTGRLVKVISLDELGTVRIGKNITEYAWDGTDMYGDKLANGVYFYRVITSINGQNIKKLITGSEKYFKKGFGKMYIMR